MIARVIEELTHSFGHSKYADCSQSKESKSGIPVETHCAGQLCEENVVLWMKKLDRKLLCS